MRSSHLAVRAHDDVRCLATVIAAARTLASGYAGQNKAREVGASRIIWLRTPLTKTHKARAGGRRHTSSTRPSLRP